jgi:hypothetical protein
MKMEPIRSSETSAIKTQTPGNYPKRNILQLKHGESLKTTSQMKFIQRNVVSSEYTINEYVHNVLRQKLKNNP